MKLVQIPEEKYYEYRINLMFNAYKWDPQFLDNNTIAKFALIITEEENKMLKEYTERLDNETKKAEEFLNNHLHLTRKLNLPRKLTKELKKMKNYKPERNIRLTRYDFHPTIENKWVISEVNSDVPGGFAEASIMPEIAKNTLPENNYYFKNFGENLTNAIVKKVRPHGTIMLVHCTSFSDDRQVMQFLGDKLKSKGFNIIYGAADHIRFKENEAFSILDGNVGKIDGIIRFTPLEWLIEIKPKFWQGYFNTITPSCNHPIAMFAQTKRFPFIWDELEKNGIILSTWKELLPETMEVKKLNKEEGYIYKPACGRVGEKISIKEACQGDEYERIIKDVKRHPNKYIAQKKFNSKPLISDIGEKYHVCVGSYCIEGKHAGYYARISTLPRIDSNAADIPVLIEKTK